MADQSPITVETAINHHLGTVKNAISGALVHGHVRECMARAQHSLDRIMATQRASLFPDIINHPRYSIIWTFVMNWIEFQAEGNGDEEEFLQGQRKVLRELGLWSPTPKVAEAESSKSSRATATATATATAAAPPPPPSVPSQSKHMSSAPQQSRLPDAVPTNRKVGPAPTQTSARPVPSTAHPPTAAPRPSSSKTRLPSQVAADFRQDQRGPPKPSASAAAPPAAPEGTYRRNEASTAASGANALSVNMGRMSLTGRDMSQFTPLEDMNDDSDEYVPGEERKKRKAKAAGESEQQKRSKTGHVAVAEADEIAPPKRDKGKRKAVSPPADEDEDGSADELEDDEEDADADPAPVPKRGKTARPAAISTIFVFTSPCARCMLRKKICRVQASQGKAAVACVPCNSAKVGCVGQSATMYRQEVDASEKDVVGPVIEDFDESIGMKAPPMPKKRTKRTKSDAIIVSKDAGPDAEPILVVPTKTPAQKKGKGKTAVKSIVADADAAADSTGGKKPKGPSHPAKKRARKITSPLAESEGDPEPQDPTLSVAYGVLIQHLGKHIQAMSTTLENKFDGKLSLIDAIDKKLTRFEGEIEDVKSAIATLRSAQAGVQGPSHATTSSSANLPAPPPAAEPSPEPSTPPPTAAAVVPMSMEMPCRTPPITLPILTVTSPTPMSSQEAAVPRTSVMDPSDILDVDMFPPGREPVSFTLVNTVSNVVEVSDIANVADQDIRMENSDAAPTRQDNISREDSIAAPTAEAAMEPPPAPTDHLEQEMEPEGSGSGVDPPPQANADVDPPAAPVPSYAPESATTADMVTPAAPSLAPETTLDMGPPPALSFLQASATTGELESPAAPAPSLAPAPADATKSDYRVITSAAAPASPPTTSPPTQVATPVMPTDPSPPSTMLPDNPADDLEPRVDNPPQDLSHSVANAESSHPSLGQESIPDTVATHLAPPSQRRSRSRSRSVSLVPQRRSARLGSHSPSPLPSVDETPMETEHS